MANQDKLTIHKLKFEIEVGDRNSYTHFANRISKLTKRELPDKLDKILKKYELPVGKLIIKKLHVDLGNIPHHIFERHIVQRVADGFDLFLQKNLLKIKEQITQAKFQYNFGNTFYIQDSAFTFESDLYFAESVLIQKELEKKKRSVSRKGISSTTSQGPAKIGEDFYLQKALLAARGETSTSTAATKLKAAENTGKIGTKADPDRSETETADITTGVKLGQSNLTSTYQAAAASQRHTSEEIKILKKLIDIQGKTTASQLRTIKALEILPQNLPPKTLTALEKSFLYFIKYGRLPSNVKFELGMKMLDVFNINQKDVRFFNELKKHIARDEKAKERLVRITDESNQKSLVRKKIIERKDTIDFDPKIPVAFEDYFVALVLEQDLSSFTSDIRRYNLNDMVRFFYADHPQKLRAILIHLLVNLPDSADTRQRIDKLFGKIGKNSIVKIMASFVRYAGFVNKFLNELNRVNKRSVKEAHASVLLAFLTSKDPISQLRQDNFIIDEEMDIVPRVFLKEEPKYEVKEFQRPDIVDYYLTHGSLPFSSSTKDIGLDKINIYILTLSAQQIRDLPYFKLRKYETNLHYQTVGQLPFRIIEHILKSLQPNIASEMITTYQYFKINIKSGVPEAFQNTFLLYHTLSNKPSSYLEEMIKFWKAQFGDDDKIISRRWKVSEDLEKELVKLIKIKEEPLADQLKVEYEFQSYSQDISVKNAGLVILWPFLKVYFNMLDLLNEQGDFRSLTERARACHLLQYLAVKQSFGEELYYPLNKILTGYPLEEPLPYEITMTEKEIDVSVALLKNVIKQWNALKGGSVDSLRGSFLIRDGVLAPSPNGWLLTVEKKAYDMLMDKLPWGIGMIKLSWAPYVLNVEWERNIM